MREDQWLKIAPLLPGKATDRGRSGQDNRQFVQAVLWIARSGAPWRDLPERFGKWIGFFSALTGGAKKESGKKCLFEALQEPDLDWLLLDSTLDHSRSNCACSSTCSRTKKGTGNQMKL